MSVGTVLTQWFVVKVLKPRALSLDVTVQLSWKDQFVILLYRAPLVQSCFCQCHPALGLNPGAICPRLFSTAKIAKLS